MEWLRKNLSKNTLILLTKNLIFQEIHWLVQYHKARGVKIDICSDTQSKSPAYRQHIMS